jgi:hypothetical protein
MNPFQSLREDEHFIYTLSQHFPSIVRSTLTVLQKGRLFAELVGELAFSDNYRLSVYELLSWSDQVLTIENYSYEVWQGSLKLYWYDSQAHPHDPSLAGTHPHHKHVPPNIKHNRIPAPGLTFTSSNLSLLIRELEALIHFDPT